MAFHKPTRRLKAYTAPMRKATLLLITLAVFGYPIVVTDIDDEKTVVTLSDTRDSVRVDPEVTPLPIPVLVID